MSPIIAVYVNKTTVNYPGAFEVFAINASITYECEWYWLVYSDDDDGAILTDLAKGDDQNGLGSNCSEVLRAVNVTNEESQIDSSLI